MNKNIIKINKIRSMSEIAKYSYELTINDKMFEIKKIRKNKWVGNCNYRIKGYFLHLSIKM